MATWLMSDLHQSQLLNPAWGAQQEKFTIALPGLFLNARLPVSPGEFLETDEAGQSTVDLNALLQASEPQDHITSHVQINTLGLGWSLANIRFSLWHSVKVAQQLDYTRDFLTLAWEGNSAFIGQEVDFGPDFQVVSWSEIGLGLSHKAGPVSFGFAAKYLNGIGDVSTPSTRASLYTDSDIYQLQLSTDYRVNTASFLSINDDDQLEVVSDPLSSFGFQKGNAGWAFDAGLAVHLTDKLTLAVSAIDIGSVKWDRDVENYLSSGTFTFDGLEFDNIFNRDSLNFQDAVDTLDQLFEFSERTEAYTTPLPTRVFAGATYQLNEKWQFGAVFQAESFRSLSFSGVALSARWNPIPWLGVGASWASRYNRSDQIGIQLLASLGPVRIYLTTDNAGALWSPGLRSASNARFGANLRF